MATAAVALSVSMGVMRPVLAKLTTLMGDEYKKIKGLRKGLDFLRGELGEMDALLQNMDSSAHELDPQATRWRREIIDMCYYIEDSIDDFMCTVGESDSNNTGILRRFVKYLRTFKDRRRIANQFQEIKTLVVEASERRQRYMRHQRISITTPVVVDPRIAVLYEVSATLVGIDAQKDELVNWAMEEGEQLKFMAIVGLGGIGKTTLANKVRREVGGEFECKALISVSQKPQMIELFNSLLSQFGLEPPSHACTFQDLIDKIRGHLQNKRYLIIVDDLWEKRAWDVIQCAFPRNNYSSRVMITTRIEEVARRCCGNDGFIHNMTPLSEPDSRKLFLTRIFGSQADCPSELEEVLCAILKRCNGLPLAIITVAGILASQQTQLKEAWEYILTELAPKLITNTDYEKMMDILDLSYKHLPRHLKACFLYLGTYPEDHTINKAQLVRRWVVEGFVSASPPQNVWDVAESYLNELFNRSMIQPVTDELVTFSAGCRVHDMMLDLILRKCKEDNFLSVINEPEEIAAVRDNVIHRLTLTLTTDIPRQLMTTAARNLSHVRSVTMFQVSSWSISLLLELKFVRVLELSGHRVNISSINRLSHLRYLKVICSNYYNMVLPAEIRGLRLLETLDLSELCNGNISLNLVDVPRLSQLNQPSGARLPCGIAEMKQLRTLSGISSLVSIHGLGELTDLTELSLFSEAPLRARWMDSLCTGLEKLGKLRLLEVSGSRGIHQCADPLSLLSPPFGNSLERLSLGFWTFTKVPRWVGHLRCLKELSLGAKQIFQEDVAIMGMLPKLIKLHLRIVHVPATRIVIGGGGLFTLVKWFTFDCDGISSLIFEAGAMPSLTSLTLAFDVYGWDMATPEGLQHLQGLQEICPYRTIRFANEDDDDDDDYYDEYDDALKRVFKETMDALQTRPVLTYDAQCTWFRMPEVED